MALSADGPRPKALLEKCEGRLPHRLRTFALRVRREAGRRALQAQERRLSAAGAKLLHKPLRLSIGAWPCDAPRSRVPWTTRDGGRYGCVKTIFFTPSPSMAVSLAASSLHFFGSPVVSMRTRPLGEHSVSLA